MNGILFVYNLNLSKSFFNSNFLSYIPKLIIVQFNILKYFIARKKQVLNFVYYHTIFVELN